MRWWCCSCEEPVEVGAVCFDVNSLHENGHPRCDAGNWFICGPVIQDENTDRGEASTVWSDE